MLRRERGGVRRCRLRHGVGLVQHGHLPRDEPVLAALLVVVALDIELDHGADGELHALVLGQQAVPVHEQVPGEPVRVDEAPGPLEGADVPVQPAADPIARPKERTRRDLLRDRAAAVIEGHVELHRLPCAKRWLPVLELVGHRKEKIVAVYEEVAVEGGGVEEAPAVCEAPHVAAVALSEAVVGLPADNWLQRHGVWPPSLVGLYIKLHALALLELVALALHHDALHLEAELTFEQVASHETPAAAGDVLRNSARQPLVPQRQRVAHGPRGPGLAALGHARLLAAAALLLRRAVGAAWRHCRHGRHRRRRGHDRPRRLREGHRWLRDRRGHRCGHHRRRGRGHGRGLRGRGLAEYALGHGAWSRLHGLRHGRSYGLGLRRHGGDISVLLEVGGNTS
mmetsp:Transcript_94867/g.306251  ORF Transcript_94867/g.306251 Transcript_94867/m.306251 type:complete len:397 (+) Transcript_94867:1309-2499(+)